MTFTNDGNKMALLSRDRKIRLFDVLTGKIFKTIDDSLDVYSAIQQVFQYLAKKSRSICFTYDLSQPT